MNSASPLSTADTAVLLDVARKSIAHGLESGSAIDIALDAYPQSLHPQRATFVTLKIEERLRGCIGTLSAVFPLVRDVAERSFSAAFLDPRFPRLARHEFDALRIHVSMLNPATPITFTDEAHLIEQLRPGVDGITLEQGSARATFLPAVWGSLPDEIEFLQQLKRKAGIAIRSEHYQAYRYTAFDFGDEPESQASQTPP